MKTPPYTHGVDGCAWRYLKHQAPDILAYWIIYNPEVHETYSFFSVILHRVSSDSKKSKVLPLYSHRVSVYIIDSDNKRNKVYEGKEPNLIEPPRFHGAWYCSTDKLAERAVEDAVFDVCQGGLDPSVEEKDEWAERFGYSTISAEDFIQPFLDKHEIN